MNLAETLKSKTAQKVASNTIYQVVGKAITLSVTVLATVLITRNYGRAGYGEFNIMQSFPALFFIIADFGLNAIATRELSSDWKKANKYFSNILSIRVLLSLIIMVGSIIALFFFPYSEALMFGTQLSMLLVFTQAMFTTSNIIYQARLRYDLSTIGLVTGYLFIILGVVLGAHFNWDIIWINFSYVIGGIVTFLINLNFVRRFGIKIEFAFDKEFCKSLFIQSLPLGLMFIFSQINFKSDAILLSVLDLPVWSDISNTEAVALYGLPYKIFEVSLIIPTFFMNSVYPIFVRHRDEGPNMLKKTFFQSMLVLFGAGILVGIVGYFVAPLVIRLLGGDQFDRSVDVLRILLSGVFIFYLTQPLSWLIVTLKKQIYLPFIYAGSAILNLTLNIIAIPIYSFYASAFLTWFSELFILIMLIVVARKVWKESYAKGRKAS